MLGLWWDSFSGTRTLEEQKLSAYMDMLSDLLFVGVYMATLFQIVEEGREIDPSRDSMPFNLIISMVLVLGLLLMEVYV